MHEHDTKCDNAIQWQLAHVWHRFAFPCLPKKDTTQAIQAASGAGVAYPENSRGADGVNIPKAGAF
ncbi:MAG: hypothetical protein ACO1SV_00600 [Fimbriimonas sp.]